MQLPSPFLLLFAFLISGCTSSRDGFPASRPFAQLYGATQAKWIDDTTLAVFNHSGGDMNSLNDELVGFKALDAENQELYLVIRFCQHQPANAEGGSQLWLLMSELKISKKALLAYMLAQDPKAIEDYAEYLRGSSKQFYSNVSAFCKH